MRVRVRGKERVRGRGRGRGRGMRGGDMSREEKDGKRRRVNPNPKLRKSDIQKVRELSKN